MSRGVSTILITGVTDGIGRALAQHYVAVGARVIGIGRRPAVDVPAAFLSDGAYCQVDLARPAAAAAISLFLDERGINRLDVLIHNAAVGWYGPIAEQSAAAIAEALAVNLRAPIALTHALLPRVTAARGVVAFVSSVHASLPVGLRRLHRNQGRARRFCAQPAHRAGRRG